MDLYNYFPPFQCNTLQNQALTFFLNVTLWGSPGFLNRDEVIPFQSFPRSVVPSFRCSRLLPPNFFYEIFSFKIEKFLQKWIPALFLRGGGGVSPKTCLIFPEFFLRPSRLLPPEIFFLSPGRQKKSKFFLKFKKFQHI